MHLFGFSLNALSLFGLVLAIGIVVDDAIVVVENVERNIGLGFSPREATRRAMDEVSGPVVAIAFVLTAVFVPTAFISGISGEFYKQFALTIAVSTLISAFNSLTLSPAMCALLLKPHGAKKDVLTRVLDTAFGWFFRGFNRVFESGSAAYSRAVGRVLRASAIALVVYVGLLVATWFGFEHVPSGFIPPQDKGYLVMFAQLPDGASLERTQAVADRAAQIARETPGIGHTVEFAGFSVVSFGNSSNAATIFLPLKPYDERRGPNLTSDAIAHELTMRLSVIQDAFIGVFGPPPVNGLGTVGGFKLMLQDRGGAGLVGLQSNANAMMAAAAGDPRLQGVFSTFRASVPQLFLDVDRVKAKSMGVSLDDVFETLQIYLGSLYVNDFNLFGRTYQVMAQADSRWRLRPEDIGRLKVRNQAGEMVPIASLADVRESAGPDRVLHYNMYPTAELNGSAAPGVGANEATGALEELAHKTLPSTMGYEWTDLTYQEKLAGNTSLYIFPLSVLFVFLTLAALYESWSLPLSIILIVPMCLLAAIAGTWIRGMDNNIFTQIGFVVLVGLACKNAILIVEFAKTAQEQGKNAADAAIEASRLRLRPILMTSLAFIFGVIPLVLAGGAGSEMRRALGTAVFSGMLGVTLFGLILTPVFFFVIRRRAKVRKLANEEATAGHAPAVA
jgi:multidrug efflux pump